MFITAVPACHADKNFQDPLWWSYRAMNSLLHRSREESGARCKRECKEAFLQRGSSSTETLHLVILNSSCPYSAYRFRKTILQFSFPEHYKSSCENSQTAQKICLLSELSGGFSSSPLLVRQTPTRPLIGFLTKMSFFIFCSQTLFLSFLVLCLFSIIHPSMRLFIQ